MSLKRLGLPLFASLVLVTLAAQDSQAGFIVSIQPIQVCQDDGTGCATTGFFEAETDKIWAQAGIDVNFLSTAQLNETDFLSIDTDANEHQTLYTAGNAINDPNNSLAINMFFVTNIDPGTIFGLGCGSTVFQAFCGSDSNGDPLTGIIIDDVIFSIARLDTIAHEIGHVLDLLHTSDDGNFLADPPTNLMTRGAFRTVPGSINDITPDGANVDQLAASQITTALNSRFVQVPEPSALYLFVAGLGLVWFFAGRRRVGLAERAGG